jgi:N-acetylneuraminic acid mutarotase
VETNGEPTARHEAALVAYKDKLYLIGGRRINPVDIYDPATNSWTAASKTPIELHHFQAVVHGDAIYLIGAMTGGWPKEKPLEKVVVYYPEKDEFKFIHTIPESRRRGGAGAVVYNDQIYIVGGITNGHMDGYQPWLDRYDPKSGVWTPLSDAPNARDHFQATVVGDRLYSLAGRTTSQKTNQGFDLTVACDVYDFGLEEWTKEPIRDIPTPRAGNMAIGYDGKVIVGGGESMAQKEAHDEVEIYDPELNAWHVAAPLNRGRHGSGFAVIGDWLYTASGCGNRGGNPELTSLERYHIKSLLDDVDVTNDRVKQWQTVSLDFRGVESSETGSPNPFTDYRLLVRFTHVASGETKTVRGYYAADGYAANTHATDGDVWRAKFSTGKTGKWNWQATLMLGHQIAIDPDATAGVSVLKGGDDSGSFEVIPCDEPGRDFRTRGRVVVENQRFKLEGSDDYWLKAGTDSPENLLAFEDFDATRRIAASKDDGEAKTDSQIHRYEAHLKDWKNGDLTWKGEDGELKGKGLVGAINYLSSKGMNSAYFLTMNIKGDGKDVWPYLEPDDFTRFDCSKLDQWELVFDHMQSRGVALHVQLQETENETMLDDGFTGPLRKLYFAELVSRFGHHPALIWNLGEENGPAQWTPIGQTPEQRIAMADYLTSIDPYNHPIVMHTHADMHSKKELLTPLLGQTSIDGLSFQVDKREVVHAEFAKWFSRSKAAGHPWLISMDEIGKWDTGAQTDAEDPDHDTLRRYVLWGSLMGGSAGVEWYFGANSPHNDLTSEDWRQRDRLWDLTRYAHAFFEQHLPWWEMESADDLVTSEGAYCLAKRGEVYAVYFHRADGPKLDLEEQQGSFSVQWYDPLNGGELKSGSVDTISGGVCDLGKPPKSDEPQDWVVLVTQTQ